jgi:hypothetical protein
MHACVTNGFLSQASLDTFCSRQHIEEAMDSSRSQKRELEAQAAAERREAREEQERQRNKLVAELVARWATHCEIWDCEIWDCESLYM